jgi:hypothetical protein
MSGFRSLLATMADDALNNNHDWVWVGKDLQLHQLDLDLDDEPLRQACGALTQQLQLCRQVDPLTAAKYFKNALKPQAWDVFGTLLTAVQTLAPLAAATSLNGAQSDVNTRQPVAVGSADSSGNIQTGAADGVIAGHAVPTQLSPAIKLGKRFLFASHPEVRLTINLDPSTGPNEARYIVPGGGVELSGKTSKGTPLKLTVGIGRDQTDRGAGFIKVQIGGDPSGQSPYLPPTQP